MSHLVQSHWLWLFGALSLGIVVGWLTYFVAAPRWTDRALPTALGALLVVVLLILARIASGRHGDQLAFGVVLAVTGLVGCLVGRGLRDLSEFVPAPRSGTTAAASGSYLFRDAHAGLGAESPYMRATAGYGSPAPVRVVPRVELVSSAPARGGYTFPATLPFADATRPSDAARGSGLRRHWSWPA